MDRSLSLASTGAGQSLIAHLLGRFLRKAIHRGSLSVETPSGETITIEGRHTGHQAHLKINNWRSLWRIAQRGGVGFAEAYIAGEWQSRSLNELLNLVAENLDTLDSLVNPRLLHRITDCLRHQMNRNSESGSARNISFHYDLGNDFYGAWLDDTMSYSAGIYKDSAGLESAQHSKYSRLTDSVGIDPEHNILEIGCGWGGLLEHLAVRHCRATGISISREQVNYATQRLADRPDVNAVLQDYRHVTGKFDRIFSIEMFEAVGEAYWETFAAQLANLLKRDGKAAMQVITIDEDAFDDYRRRPDFIQQYVFPGGMLPTVTQLQDIFSRQGLKITDLYRFGQDYATTLADWRHRFTAAWPRLSEQGFDTRFYRTWLYYLGYCEAGFSSGRTDVVQLRLEHA